MTSAWPSSVSATSSTEPTVLARDLDLVALDELAGRDEARVDRVAAARRTARRRARSRRPRRPRPLPGSVLLPRCGTRAPMYSPRAVASAGAPGSRDNASRTSCPEARRVVHDAQVAGLVPDDVVEHRLGREQQPPVEAHRAARRARAPARALVADRERRVARAAARRRRASRRGAISSRAARRNQRSIASARGLRVGGDEQLVAAAVHARAAGLRARAARSVPRYGTVAPRAATASRTACPAARRCSIHGRSSATAAGAALAGLRRGSTTSTPVWGSTRTRTRRARSERRTR